jgi:hypothetical protein
MPLATISTVGSRPRRGAVRGRRPAPYRLSAFVLAYVLALVTVIGALFIGGLLAIPIYFLVGIALSRFISRRVRWWKIANNVENVASVKVHTVLAWPIAVPRFVFTVALAKWL